MDSVTERIKRTHSEGWSHRGFYLLSRHPPDLAGFRRGMHITAGWPTPIHQGNDPVREVFVNTRETFDRDLKTGFLKHLAQREAKAFEAEVISSRSRGIIVDPRRGASITVEHAYTRWLSSRQDFSAKVRHGYEDCWRISVQPMFGP